MVILEEVSMEDHTQTQSRTAKSIARGYQMEYLRKAKEKNIIVCLETGCGKTLIAVLLLEELSHLFPSSEPRIAVFLVPTVMLVQQQANVIEELSELKVGQYNSQKDGGKWNLKKWENDICNLQVLVMTPQALLNSLRHALVKMECIKVLIFDECHHCQKGHPYAQIMEEYYFQVDECSRPRILGMTASPVIRKGNCNLQSSQDLEALENLLDSKIMIVEDRRELDALVPSPNIEVLEYDRVYDSYDRLQSFVKMINNCKVKEDCLQAAGNIEYWKKRTPGIDRIYRDLEYCIYELGLWFARQAVKDASTSFAYYFPEEGNYEGNYEDNRVLLRDISGCFDKQYSKDEFDNLEFGNLKPDIVSKKVISMVKLLRRFRLPQERCIIFVERVVAAKVLASFLSLIFESVKCHYVVGGMHSSSRKSLTDTVNKFRSGQINLLIATSVAEEGLDIQQCNLVIHFDMPKTLRSYIQSRGRARVRASHYIILKDRANIAEEKLLDALAQNEHFVKEKIMNDFQTTTASTRNSKNSETEMFQVEKTGAIVSIQSSVQLLHFYCSTLPGDKFYSPKPIFRYSSEPDGIKCDVLLPSNALIRFVAGEPRMSKSVAKKAVCLRACFILHSKGELTDNLLPRTGSIPSENSDSSFNSSNIGKSLILQETIVPAVWILPTKTINPNIISLHTYMISFVGTPTNQEYTNFALLLQSPMPEAAINISLILELRHGKTVSCKLEPFTNISLDNEQEYNVLQEGKKHAFPGKPITVFLESIHGSLPSISQAEKYQSTLFSIILDHNLENLNHVQRFTTDEGWYLLLPMRLSQDFTHHEIDWIRIHELCSSRHSHSVAFQNDAFSSSITGTLQFTNAIIPINEVPGLLVRTTGGNKLYYIMDVFKHLTALSHFPDPKYENYVDYFQKRHNIEILHAEQPLLKAKFLGEAYNYLQVRHIKKDVTDYNTGNSSNHSKSIVELPAEICDILMYGLHDSLVNAAILLPSFMQRLEGVLAATQLRDFFSSQFPEASLVSVDKVLEALTTENCSEHFSLERLELLGDSFLKFAVSCQLFVRHSEAHEGFLSLERVKKICNLSLYRLGSNCGLPSFIRDQAFDPKFWIAPCHRSKIVCNENKIMDLHGEPAEMKGNKQLIVCSKRHRWMKKKTVADVVEALIGAYLEDAGESAALAFMEAIGIEATTEYQEKLGIHSLSDKNLALIRMINISAIEELISYNFRQKGLLIEAFTHASFTTHHSRCYQRLEFLGDSVLDFLITRHLYETHSAAKPGELSDMRSAIVSNESFARITVELGLYEHVIHSSPELKICITDFVQFTSENRQAGDWDGDKCPKVLGDILEALAGAVFVDGGFNLDLTWEIFEPILEPVIANRKNKLHPVRELLELSQKYGFPLETDVFGEGMVNVTYTIRPSNIEVITGTAAAKDKRSSMRHAALDCLNKLKALGYTHSSNRQAKLAKQKRAAKAVSHESRTQLKEMLNSETLTCFCDESEQGCTLPCSSELQKEVSEHTIRTMAEISLQEPLDFQRDIGSDMEIKATGTGTSTATAITAKPSGEGSTQAIKDELIRMEHTATERQQKARAFGNNILHLPKSEVINITPPEDIESTRMLQSQTIEIAACGNRMNSPFLHGTSFGFSQQYFPGQSISQLHEICAKRRWLLPFYECICEEGPPHDKRFTFDVNLQLLDVGLVKCSGDPKNKVSLAKDSAAAELLSWLRSEGYI